MPNPSCHNLCVHSRLSAVLKRRLGLISETGVAAWMLAVSRKRRSDFHGETVWGMRVRLSSRW